MAKRAAKFNDTELLANESGNLTPMLPQNAKTGMKLTNAPFKAQMHQNQGVNANTSSFEPKSA